VDGLCLYKVLFAKYGVAESDIYNFDETGFMMGIISTGMVVTNADPCSSAKLSQPGGRGWVTAIQGINSQGWTIPPFIIVAGKYHLSTWYDTSPLPKDWVIATSENGWTTNERGLVTAKNIQSGFRGAGLVPLDPEYVISS